MKLLQTSSRNGRLYGTSFPAQHFKVTYCQHKIDPDAFQALLRGEALALVVEHYLGDDEADRLAESFRHFVHSDRDDGVPAKIIGSSHFKVTTEEYLDSVEATRLEIAAMYKRAGLDLDNKTNVDLSDAVSKFGQRVRPASHGGRYASPLRGAAWAGGATSDFGLAAHDDLAQVSAAVVAQRGFEIQECATPVAINIYTSVPRAGGSLRMFNIAVSPACKAAMGLAETGYPYEAADLSGVDHVDIKVTKGACAFISGKFAHAVCSWQGNALDRIVKNGFVFLKSDGSVIRWS